MCSSKHKIVEMVCKEDIIAWFKELESYKRIDTMCTLLNMCLPFELRFLGTCLEELGRRDAQELRGLELRVNNQQEFANDIQICHAGDLTDIKVRRKMALYLALLRATFNRTCINELFKTLEQWGERDFTKFSDGDPLQELLLVYTMATNHPIFTFEQRLKCGEILSKIKISKQVDVKVESATTSSTTIQQQQQQLSTPSTSTYSSQLQAGQFLHNSTSTPPPGSTQLPPHNPATIPTNMFQMLAPTNPAGFTQTMSQIIPESLASHMTVDSMGQLQLPANMIIPTDFSMPPPNTVPWFKPQHNFQPFQPMSIEGSFHQSASSPMLSQPSSPVHSRTASPTRNLRGNTDDNSSRSSTTGNSQSSDRVNTTGNRQQVQGNTRGNVRSNRRPSIDSTPPPPPPSAQSQILSVVPGNEIILSQNLKGDFNEVNIDGSLTQLRNGYTRPIHHTIPRQSNKQQSSSYMHQSQQSAAQQSQNQNPISNYNITNLQYPFANMNLMEMSVHGPSIQTTTTTVHHHKSTGSDSGSSVGSGEISPPETPGLQTTQNVSIREVSGNNRRGMTRGINGRQQQQQQQQQQEKNQGDNRGQAGSVIYMTSSPSQQFTGTGVGGTVTSEILVSTSSNLGNSSLISSNSQNNLQQLATGSTSAGSVMVNNVILPSHLQSINSGATQFVNPGFPAYHPPVNRSLVSTTATGFRHPTQPTFSPLQPQDATTQLLYIPQPIQFLQPAPPPPQTNITSNMRSSPSLQQSSSASSTSGASGVVPQTSAVTSALPTNKMNQSCFNCGSTAHIGRECQESSMEDVTRNTIYKLDYTSNVPIITQTPTTTTVGVVQPTIQQPPPSALSQNQSNQPSHTQTTTSIPKIKPLFNPEIVPKSTIDPSEVISLLSSDSSRESTSSSK